ncbi:BREX-1 system adenine-specific DNA-methyltransferase PglX, partial [Nitrosomonas halophila]
MSAASARNTLSAQRDQQNVSGAEKQTNPWPLTPIPSASTREEDFLRIEKPEDIKICDPACGSGHMLTYAFDLLYAIYEEEGVDPAEIPEKILTNNLYGIEIDERAGELAAFALTMKARAKQRRFFNKSVKPNICVLQNIHFDEDELKEYMDFIGYDLFTAPLQATLRQFEEADNFGSLIRPDVTDVDRMRSYLKLKNVSGHLFLSKTHEKVLQALQQADYLSPKYHVVIANPPYMGSVGMNPKLKSFAAKHYKLSKGDLFSMFIERSFHLSSKQGFISMITLQNWMFLSSYEAIRLNILEAAPIRSLVQVGFNSFPELNSKFALGAAFILQSQGKAIVGDFVNLNDAPHAANKQEVFLERKRSGKIYRVNPRKFSNIPGSPIQYSLSDGVFRAFSSNPKLGDLVDARNGMTTGDNENFVRRWNEVSFGKTSIASHSGANVSTRWFPYNKGGQTRKWYGNQETVVDWRSDGLAIKAIRPKSTTRNTDFFFRESVSWSDINIKNPSFRYYDDSFCFDAAVNSAFPSTRSELLKVLSACNNCFVSWMAPILNPTMHFKIGDFSVLPAAFRTDERVEQEMETVLAIARSDWDSYETSWDFASLPLLNPDYRQPTLKTTYQKLRAHWREMTLEMQRLEEENNRIFIEAYGLQDELTPEVPLNEITLTCNPWYRYNRKLTTEHTESTENNHSKNSVCSVYSVVKKSFPIDDEL